MKIYLIRHSMTEGNLKKRYIGRTDEDLCQEGIELLKEKMGEHAGNQGKTCGYPPVQAVFVSPMRRCIQTAEMIYPGQKYTIVELLKECDFGLFENRNYLELSDCPEYQEWIDSGGMLPFPEGESREVFIRRTLKGFREVLDQCRNQKLESAALVVHGGTIMSIMEQYACLENGWPSGSYYDYQVGNGEGYELRITESDMDDYCSGSRICAGSDPGRSQVAVSSGEADRSSDYRNGKNYQKLFAQN